MVEFVQCCHPLISDVGEARCGQTLGTYFFTQSQARRIQALHSKFLSDFEPFLAVNLYRLFWRQRFCSRSQRMAYKLSSNLFFSSLIRYFTVEPVSRTHPTNKGEPKHFLIYHYITGINTVVHKLYIFSFSFVPVVLVTILLHFPAVI